MAGLRSGGSCAIIEIIWETVMYCLFLFKVDSGSEEDALIPDSRKLIASILHGSLSCETGPQTVADKDVKKHFEPLIHFHNRYSVS